MNGMAEKRTLTSRHLRLSNLSEILDSANLRGSGYKPVVPSTVCRVHCPCGRGGRGAGTNSQGAQQTGAGDPRVRASCGRGSAALHLRRGLSIASYVAVFIPPLSNGGFYWGRSAPISWSQRTSSGGQQDSRLEQRVLSLSKEQIRKSERIVGVWVAGCEDRDRDPELPLTVQALLLLQK